MADPRVAAAETEARKLKLNLISVLNVFLGVVKVCCTEKILNRFSQWILLYDKKVLNVQTLEALSVEPNS